MVRQTRRGRRASFGFGAIVGDGAGGESKAEREKTEVGYVLPLCFLLAAVVTKPTRDGG